VLIGFLGSKLVQNKVIDALLKLKLKHKYQDIIYKVQVSTSLRISSHQTGLRAMEY